MKLALKEQSLFRVPESHAAQYEAGGGGPGPGPGPSVASIPAPSFPSGGGGGGGGGYKPVQGPMVAPESVCCTCHQGPPGLAGPEGIKFKRLYNCYL